jgi:cell division protein FtsN
MTSRFAQSNRGATRLGFVDIVVVAIVTAILLFAAWKQFPAYDRPFKPLRIITPISRPPVPASRPTPVAPVASQP